MKSVLLIIIIVLVMGSLAIIISAKDYAETAKQEQQQKLEKLELTPSSGCIYRWPLKRENYDECMENIRKRMYRGDI